MKLLALLILSLSTYANQKLTSDDFLEIEKKVYSKAKKFGVKNVLVVLDIDNTIMKMPQDLGSDTWWGWQEKTCIGKKALPKHCVSNNFTQLLEVQGQIFAMSKMLPTQKETPQVIRRLQKKGYKVILLTSRGHAFRSATEKELKRNNMNFINSAIGPKKGFAGTYKPYDLKKFKQYGLTKDDMVAMGNKKPRAVSFQNGIFMTAGLNKGIMLKTLLHKTQSKFKAIIFADDHEKHSVRMHAILGKVKDIDLTTYRYTKIDPEVKRFKESDKKQAKIDLKAFLSLRNKVFK
ncbi:MAG: DUF2608 domain-containing protein [Bacteriovoracaceae bacterium]|jgi:hypothetical protein|nr:DUF2608 domain-containing protein [Bacteriovoracaceae bacterium]